MAMYKTGTFTVTDKTVAQNLVIGFQPSLFICENLTLLGTSGSGIDAQFSSTMSALTTPITKLRVSSAGTITQSTLTTTGISYFSTADANLFVPNQAPYTTTTGNKQYIGQSTLLPITAISKAANASITATHSFTSSDIGVTTVTFHGILGMTQLNGLRGVIQSVTSTTSFTVNINTTNFGTYSAGVAGLTGGFANVVTGAPANTLYGNVSLPTAQANLGQIGVTIGTGVMNATGGANSDVYSYHAWLYTPANA